MITTVQLHILQEQKCFPGASGGFSWLLSAITLATKMVEAKIRRAGLSDILGEFGAENVQGEMQQKLDVYANAALRHCLSARTSVGVLASEENEQPMIMGHCAPAARYAVVFDPLDGSSNIDVNVSVGTTFSILRRPMGVGCDEPEQWLLQPGKAQIAAGYVIYSSSTMLVYSCGNGVHGFTLDPSVGAFVLSHPNIKMPHQGKYYSVNEAHAETFPAGYQEYLRRLRRGELGRTYSSRYIGSMVADFHRTLLKGGVFMYPPTADNPRGKLRTLYEANPVALLAEQAGGMATNGERRMLDAVPTGVHERTPLVVGSEYELRAFRQCVPHLD